MRTFASGEAMRKDMLKRGTTATSETAHDCGCQDRTMDLEAEVQSLKLMTTTLCEVIENMLVYVILMSSTSDILIRLIRDIRRQFLLHIKMH